MKKKWILISVLLLLIILIFSSLLFIPNNLKVGANAEAAINHKAPARYLQDTSVWKKWWPGNSLYTINNTSFVFDKTLAGNTQFTLNHKGDVYYGNMTIVAETPQLCKIVWRSEIKTTGNPINKWIAYFKARKIKAVFEQLAAALSRHLTIKNVYGIEIKEVKVKDSVLIATRSFFNHYPTPAETGEMINKLSAYIKQQNSIEKNRPMLHVHQHADTEFETLVAIATDKLLSATTEFEPKRVLKGGNILEAEYTGGPVMGAQLFQQLELYKTDLGLTAAAIPYQLLVTDRVKETDTTKWVTRFYYPYF